MMSAQRTPRRLASVALLLCGTFLSHSAIAQVSSPSKAVSGSDYEVAPVIVTARKQAENVESIPESITAIDSHVIAAAHLTTLDDFNSLVTNINIVQRADNTPDVVLRGVGTFGVVQGVGFYVNDVQQFDGQSVRPVDIDRIEVLKGPQGTLFGGSNVGGAIKYVTKLPSNTPTAEASFEYGEYNDRTVDAAVSGPIVPQKLLARVSAFNEESDGYLYDPILQRILPKSDETGGRVTLEYLGDQTTVIFYLAGDHIKTQNMNLYYTPPNDHSYSLIYNGGVDGTVPYYKRDLYSPTLEISHDFGNVELTSISSYFHSSIGSIGNLDKGAFLTQFDVPVFSNYLQDFEKSVWSQEVRLSSHGDSAFKWLIGGFVQEIDSNAVQIQTVGIAATVGSPVGATAIAPPAATAYGHINRDYAIFGNASYERGPWTVEGGLRISYLDNSMTDTTGYCLPCSGKVNQADFLPKLSIDYHFSKDVMGYFTVARGDEEADFTDNPTGTVEPVAPFRTQNSVLPFKTEFALSYEAGVKSQLFDHRLTLNAAAFYIDYTDRLFEVGKFVGTGIFTYEANVGASTNYGFELEAVARPVRELTVTAGVGVTRAIFGPVTFLDGFGNPVSAAGSAAPETPEYQANLAVDWRHHLTDDLVFGARVDTRFVGRSFWDATGCAGPALTQGLCPAAGFRFQQRPYQIVNLGISLDIGKHFTVGARVENVFDTRFNTLYADASETGAPYNVASINRPRQWLLNFTARY
jgi:iron complex outermembrane receptor protein